MLQFRVLGLGVFKEYTTVLFIGLYNPKNASLPVDFACAFPFDAPVTSLNRVYFGYCPPLSNSWITSIIWLYSPY